MLNFHNLKSRARNVIQLEYLDKGWVLLSGRICHALLSPCGFYCHFYNVKACKFFKYDTSHMRLVNLGLKHVHKTEGLLSNPET